jgi:hypothetical protein
VAVQRHADSDSVAKSPVQPSTIVKSSVLETKFESPDIPSNSFHFIADCKSLRNSPQNFYSYFKVSRLH